MKKILLTLLLGVSVFNADAKNETQSKNRGSVQQPVVEEARGRAAKQDQKNKKQETSDLSASKKDAKGNSKKNDKVSASASDATTNSDSNSDKNAKNKGKNGGGKQATNPDADADAKLMKEIDKKLGTAETQAQNVVKANKAADAKKVQGLMQTALTDAQSNIKKLKTAAAKSQANQSLANIQTAIKEANDKVAKWAFIDADNKILAAINKSLKTVDTQANNILKTKKVADAKRVEGLMNKALSDAKASIATLKTDEVKEEANQALSNVEDIIQQAADKIASFADNDLLDGIKNRITQADAALAGANNSDKKSVAESTKKAIDAMITQSTTDVAKITNADLKVEAQTVINALKNKSAEAKKMIDDRGIFSTIKKGVKSAAAKVAKGAKDTFGGHAKQIADNATTAVMSKADSAVANVNGKVNDKINKIAPSTPSDVDPDTDPNMDPNMDTDPDTDPDAVPSDDTQAQDEGWGDEDEDGSASEDEDNE